MQARPSPRFLASLPNHGCCARSRYGKGIRHRMAFSTGRQKLSDTTRSSSEDLKSEFQNEKASQPNDLLRIITTHIKTHGPLPLARYMHLCLSHPTLGYYTRLQRKGEKGSDTIIGQKGDFITSPEISQVFGELLAIWYISQWQAQGMPTKTRIIELGPGKGTLMEDMLRTFTAIKMFRPTLQEVNLVETSEYFKGQQREKLQNVIDQSELQVNWYNRIQDVPIKDDSAFTMIVAHEFFDALPIHLFEKRPEGFREVFVDIDDPSKSNVGKSSIILPTTSNPPVAPASTASSEPQKLRYAVSPSTTLAAKIFAENDPKYKGLQDGTRIEVCTEAYEIAEKCAELVGKSGAGLFIDYGGERFFGNSFRAFKNHQIVNPLEEPGSADLTSNVNFSFLREALTSSKPSDSPASTPASIPNSVYSPPILSQRSFLLSLGLQLRIQTLLNNTPDEKRRENMIKSAERLVEKNEKVHGMGKVFKVMGFVPKKEGSQAQEVFPFGQELD